MLYVSSTHIKIADFGFSTPVTDEALSTFCGSPAFAAPELLCEQSYLGPPVDMWALGATLYYIVSGNVPFPGNSVLQVKENVLRGNYTALTRVGPVCQELVGRLLSTEPSNRPSVSTVREDTWLDGVSQETEPSVCRDVVDEEVVGQMRELGIPVGEDTSLLLREPRTPIAGTYRILLHQKMEGSGKRVCWKLEEAQVSGPQKKSKFCTIL